MAHLPKNHPVRFLLDSAAQGHEITAGDLDAHLGNTAAGLPEGQSLDRYRQAVSDAAKSIHQIAVQTGGRGESSPAHQAATDAWDRISERFTPAQTNYQPTNDDAPIDDMVAKLFNH